MKCDSRASLLAHTLANLDLGCEPKVRVATILGKGYGIKCDVILNI
jgi:hypothetical protein